MLTSKSVNAEYTELISAVKDKYDDFIIAFDSSRISEEHQQELVHFLKNNPGATTSEVIFRYGQLKGVIPKEMKHSDLTPPKGE